jgi:hypothetical protein
MDTMKTLGRFLTSALFPLSLTFALFPSSPPFALCPLPFALVARSPVETLLATDALPAHLMSQMRAPAAYVALSGGAALVFDRGAQAVFRVNAARTAISKIVDIGQKAGEILRPIEFAAGPAGMFAVADMPFDRERVQLFLDTGSLFGGFGLPAHPGSTLTVSSVALSGIGGIQFTGPSLFINVPESGALITEFDQQGHAVRQIGALRRTGQESNKSLHLALNLGIPLADPAGGFYFLLCLRHAPPRRAGMLRVHGQVRINFPFRARV